MKLRITTLVLISIMLGQIYSQKVTETFLSNGNVYVQYGKEYFHQITKLKLDSLPILSRNHKYLIYLRKRQQQEIYLTQIIRYDLNTSTEKTLIQSAEDHPEVSTPISYADSRDYPFSCLGGIENIKLSPDNERIYFETSAWVVAGAVHYYDISTGKIYFFHSGSLNKIYPNGTVSIQMTDIATDKKGNSGRYWQDWLYDKNGVKIKALSKKQY